MQKWKQQKHHPHHIPHCGRPPHCGSHCGHHHHEHPQKPWGVFSNIFWAFYYLKLMPIYFYFFFLLFPKKKEHKVRRTKVAFVSVYNTACGIATYNENLLKELRKYADVTVFAEYADEKRSKNIETDPDFVIRCWDREEHPKHSLLTEIENLNPDIIHICHEFGFFAKSYYFTSLISLLKHRSYPVLTTFHSVYDHLDKAVQESASDYIMVHTEEAEKCLVKKGINKKSIRVIPHGSKILAGTDENPQLIPALWNTWGNDHTIYQPGFLFTYKGHLNMLPVIAELKRQYPDVHYIIHGSENPHTMAEHDYLYNEIMKTSEALGIMDNITVRRGFVSDEVLNAHIRTVKCCILPYANHPDHDVRGTSGMARVILSTETPLIVSKVHLFDDIDGVVPRVSTQGQIYHEIKKIFDDPNQIELQKNLRIDFLKKTSWGAVGRRVSQYYHDIIEDYRLK